MKIERISDESYHVYVYSFDGTLETLKESISDLMKIIQKRIKISGFYRVIACLKSIGLFLQIIPLDHSLYKDTLDLKIELDHSFDVYYCCDDYFLIKDCFSVKYFNGKFYALVDDSFDKIMEKVEFGDFVFGEEFLKGLDNAFVIQ